MDKLIIPANPNWFCQNVCFCTPDNGFIYAATSKIIFVPPKISEKSEYEIKILDLKKKLNCFALCPNYQESKRIAVVNGDFHVLVYNFETEEILKAHKGHNVEIETQNPFSSVSFTTENIVLSSVNSDLIKFCLLTNTIKVYPDFSGRNPITIMKTYPNNANFLAAGTKNGLILLIDSENMTITSRLRGQDMEITSMDFISIPSFEKKKSEAGCSGSNNTKKQIEPIDDNDIFDIYSYEKVENEFGVYQATDANRSDCDEDETPLKEKLHNTVSFNFLEECTTLKDQILSSADTCNLPTSLTNQATPKFEDNEEQYGVKNEDNISIDISLQSNQSSHTPVLTEESLNFLDECQRLKDFAETAKDQTGLIILASGSRENVVWLWNVIDCRSVHKIKWHPKAKSHHHLPSVFTNVLWLNQETLLITDNNGEIIQHKITLNQDTKKFSDQKQNRVFDVKGVLSICKSRDGTVVWASSIHRHICCFETTEFSKVVSLDTLQFRIHYMMESSFDSNLIAIGGNDKRLCLWNTSELSPHYISLKPYMNKIQTSILCVSWHPLKENILAFSTREGRIGVLDTNKSSNVPIILESFSTNEIYSMTWAKYLDSNDTETVILLACSSGKLVFYSNKDYKLNLLDQFKQVCSISARDNLLAIGTNSGTVYICDMLMGFTIVAEAKICRKYIGMITWSDNSLAISRENGVSVIRNIKNTVNTEDFQANAVNLPHLKRVYSVRFNRVGDCIATGCLNGAVTVWNLNTLNALSRINIHTPVYCALFLPSNEKILICGGKDSTVLMFDWEKYASDNESIGKSLKNEDKLKHINWATLSEITKSSKHNNRRIKKKVQLKGGASAGVGDITNGVKTLNLSSKKISSIFHAANREITVNPTSYLETILNEDPDRKPTMNEKFFGSRNDIKIIIDKEMEVESNSMVGIIMPQMTDNLKDDLLEKISSKKLTEIHVAIAPSVSYELWKKCCLAFGNQCIENDDFIRAIPYLLAVNDIDNLIIALCKSKFFREAWVIAKMRKDEHDSTFEKILQQWLGYLDHSGNYEVAAAILCIRKDYKKAQAFLGKRQNMDDKLVEIYNKLSSRV